MVENMSPFEARRIIEALRAGVPSKEVSRVLLAGRDQLIDEYRSALAQLGSTDEAPSMVIYSAYGGGKSHFLSAAANLALLEGYAVSQLVLSKETPFNRLRLIYEVAAHSIQLNNYPRRGFEEALMKLRVNSNKYFEIRDHLSNLHPKIGYVFVNYFKEADPSKNALLFEDLAGAPLPMGTIRAIHRANFHEAMGMSRQFLVNRDTPDYFKFLSQLIRGLGYKGWVILLDEAELIGKLGIGGRGQAYLNLNLLLGLEEANRIEGVYTIAAFATNFQEDRLLGQRGDLTTVPQWFLDPRRNRSVESTRATSVIRHLIEKGHRLPALTKENADLALQQLEKLHRKAYGWDARLDRDQVLNWTQTQLNQGSIRTTIRAAIEYLDVGYQGITPKAIELHEPDVGEIREDDSFFDVDDPTGNKPKE